MYKNSPKRVGRDHTALAANCALYPVSPCSFTLLTQITSARLLDPWINPIRQHRPLGDSCNSLLPIVTCIAKYLPIKCAPVPVLFFFIKRNRVKSSCRDAGSGAGNTVHMMKSKAKIKATRKENSK